AEAVFASSHCWVLNLDPRSFVEIDPATGKVLTQISSPVSDVGYYAVQGNSLWVTDAGGPNLVQVDVGLGREVNRFHLGPGVVDQNVGLTGVVVAAGSVWVAENDDPGDVLRLDPATGAVQQRFQGLHASGLAFGDGSIWTGG